MDSADRTPGRMTGKTVIIRCCGMFSDYMEMKMRSRTILSPDSRDLS